MISKVPYYSFDRKLKLFVILSVAINLFLIGVVAAPFLGRGPIGMPPPPLPHELMVERFTRDLPAADAARVRAIFEEDKRALSLRHEAEHEAFRKLADVLRQEKPDLQEMRLAQEAIWNSGRGFHEAMAKVMQRLVTELPLESRRKIAETMERGPMGPPPGGLGGPPDHGPGGPPSSPPPEGGR